MIYYILNAAQSIVNFMVLGESGETPVQGAFAYFLIGFWFSTQLGLKSTTATDLINSLKQLQNHL